MLFKVIVFLKVSKPFINVAFGRVSCIVNKGFVKIHPSGTHRTNLGKFECSASAPHKRPTPKLVVTTSVMETSLLRPTGMRERR